MVKMSGKIGVITALGLMLTLVVAACGGDDPTPTPPPAATPTPTAMAAEATPTAMMEERATPTPLPPGVTPPPATPTQVPTATPTPRPPDPGFDAEGYFSGKTMRLMVGFNPGGGTDAQARFMSREWPKYIPGNPRIVVTNRTPVVVQRNFVWNSEPNGLTLAVEATPGIFDMQETGAEFDMREVTMIGVTSGNEGMWVRLASQTPDLDCFDSAWGISAPTLTMGTIVPTWDKLGGNVVNGWLADEFNIPLEIKNVNAPGSNEQYLFLEQGVLNTWTSGTLWDQLPRTRPDWLPSGFIAPFADLSMPNFDLGHNGQVDFHCPNVHDAYLDDAQKELYVAMRGPQIYAAKNIIGPPGIPDNVTAVLRKALADAVANPEFEQGLQISTRIKTTFEHGDVAQEVLRNTTEAYLANKGALDEIAQEVFDKYVR